MTVQPQTIDLDAAIAHAKARSDEFELITIREAAATLNVTIRTVRRWQAAGKMPAQIKHGRNKKYRRAEIEAMAATLGRDAS